MQPLPKGPLGKEPAGSVGSAISGILLGIWMVLKVAGVTFAEDLPLAVDYLIFGLLSVPAISGWLTRFFVFSPYTTQKKVNEAARTGEAEDVGPPPPEILDDDDPRYDPNNPNEVPPSQWATSRSDKPPNDQGDKE